MPLVVSQLKHDVKFVVVWYFPLSSCNNSVVVLLSVVV